MRIIETELPPLTPYFPEYSEDVSDSRRALLDGSVSAIVGGHSPLLRKGEGWPRCNTPDCNHYLIPYIQISLSSTQTPADFRRCLSPIEQEGTTLFQVFVCAAMTDSGTCFESWVNCVMEGESWLVRKVHFAADGHDVEDDARYDTVRSEMEESGEEIIQIPERVVAEWKAGQQERYTEDECFSDEEDEDEGDGDADDSGEEDDTCTDRAGCPKKGLKLLGYPTRGKFYNSTSPGGNESCEAGDAGPHYKWRCLIQLGTRDEDNPMYSCGNIFLNQCTLHPDSFEAAISGTW
ncbi:hypothetical protein PYCCODRAFT_1368158 [Trametes coccinea BRFM310]|uniref:Uncharacterized protein n=1 Tax=Trametes coccinea (strain BRFM310) TaxID=1353009 RepID=A0A1Y2ILU8_TRAC3|nr:hypothetical protein PYCCODRAFT_1368158 [Trametes coccinea BRFM310]